MQERRVRLSVSAKKRGSPPACRENPTLLPDRGG